MPGEMRGKSAKQHMSHVAITDLVAANATSAAVSSFSSDVGG